MLTAASSPNSCRHANDDKKEVMKQILQAKRHALMLLLQFLSIPAAIAAPMTVTVAPRSQIEILIEAPTRIYLEGDIDPGASKRLRAALNEVKSKTVAVEMNSPGGNLLVGMELGRIIRQSGASTRIASRSSNDGGQSVVCMSACALAFLGGVYRYSVKGSAYGVHRISRSSGPREGDLAMGQLLSATVLSYIREMGADPDLFALMSKTDASSIYILSRNEMEQLNVINNGRLPPTWTLEAVEGSTYLKGAQDTWVGSGKAMLSCPSRKLVFFSFYTAGEKTQSIVSGGWVHSLFVDDEIFPIAGPIQIENVSGDVNAMFVLTPEQFRKVQSAQRSIGHAMQLTYEAPTFVGYTVDIDKKSKQKFRTFLGNCLDGS